MTESDLSLNLAATFGPILKKSFPDASPRWRHAVAGALAESVITRRSWFAQPVDETERLREALAFVGQQATCVNGHSHYCPNCDRTLHEIGDTVNAALTDTKGDRPMGDR